MGEGAAGLWARVRDAVWVCTGVVTGRVSGCCSVGFGVFVFACCVGSVGLLFLSFVFFGTGAFFCGVPAWGLPLALLGALELGFFFPLGIEEEVIK